MTNPKRILITCPEEHSTLSLGVGDVCQIVVSLGFKLPFDTMTPTDLTLDVQTDTAPAQLVSSWEKRDRTNLIATLTNTLASGQYDATLTLGYDGATSTINLKVKVK